MLLDSVVRGMRRDCSGGPLSVATELPSRCNNASLTGAFDHNVPVLGLVAQPVPTTPPAQVPNQAPLLLLERSRPQ